MPDKLDHAHRDNRLLAALPPDVLALFERDLRQISLNQGAVIFEAGAAVDRVYFPQSGMISLLVLTKDGSTIETSTVGREGAVGLHRGLGERRSFTRATAQITGRFSVIDGRRFEQLVSGNAPMRNMIADYTEVLWAEAQQVAACNVAHNASSRLCRWLLQTSDRIERNNVALTQEFLAQMLGVRRTTVTLLAQAMQRKGLIKYSRGQIEILNRAGIEACACECYHVMHHTRLPRTIGVRL